MIDAQTIPDARLKTTPRMVRDEAIARGWQAWCYPGNYSHMRLVRPDGSELEIFSAAPPTTTYAAGLRVNDKYLTTCLQQENGMPVPESYLLDPGQEGTEQAAAMLETGRTLVVKPLDSGHGQGVTIGIGTVEKYLEALGFAHQYSTRVIVQECVTDAIDIRISCVNYKMVGAVIRVPARVMGDGESTLKQLIETENRNPGRGLNYTKPLNLIDAVNAERYLGERLDEVAHKGEYVQVVGTANLGTGGETIDITDDLPAWFVEMAEKSTVIARLPVCGVDFLVQKQPQPNDTTEGIHPKLIELNSCPALFLHDTPTVGKPRGAIKAYVDYLATI